MNRLEIQSGRNLTFEELYRRHASAVYRYSLRLSRGNEADAQDIAQEALILAYRGLNKFEGRASVLTWLFSITRRVWLRRQSAQPGPISLEGVGELPDPRLDVEGLQVQRLWLAWALARLPSHLHEALVLVKGEGLTYREAAQVLGIPQGTVQFHVRQALRQTREILSDGRGMPGAAAMFLLLFVGRELRADTLIPQGFLDRVSTEIGQQQAVEQCYLSGTEVAGRAMRATSGKGAAVTTGAIVIILASGTVWLRGNAEPHHSPRRALMRTFKELGSVPSAHAVGTVSRISESRDGTQSVQRHDTEYWFLAQKGYARITWLGNHKSVLHMGKTQSKLTLDDRHHKALTVDQNRATRNVAVASFGLFDPEGLFLQALRSRHSHVTSKRVGLNNQEANQYTIIFPQPRYTCRWNIFTSLDDKQLMRVEYQRDHGENAISIRREEVILSEFEFGTEPPPDLFTEML